MLPVVLDHAGLPRGSAGTLMAEQNAPIECKERELLLAILQQAIRGMIRSRGQEESDIALKTWEKPAER
jgi:hypothetical protein